LPRYPQEDRFPGSADNPRGLDGILRSQARDDLVAVDPEARQLSRVKFEIDLFVLRADQRDLGGVRDCREGALKRVCRLGGRPRALSAVFRLQLGLALVRPDRRARFDTFPHSLLLLRTEKGF
jgi:hypothetical protein